jgi:hypothetical protein
LRHYGTSERQREYTRENYFDNTHVILLIGSLPLPRNGVAVSTLRPARNRASGLGLGRMEHSEQTGPDF